MKRLALQLIALLVPLAAFAQSNVSELLKQIDGKRIVCEYSYESGSLKGYGTAVIQNGMYHVTGNGMDIYSDGTTRWTVDNTAKEVYIEPAGEENDIFANLNQYLAGIEGLKFDGKTMSGTIKGEDGSKLKCKATNIKSYPILSGSKEFSFNTSALDSSWVVTDLR